MSKKLLINLSFFSLFLISCSVIICSEKATMHTIFAPGVSASIKRVNTYAQAGAFPSEKHSNIIFPDQKRPKALIDKIIYRIAKKKGRTVNRGKIVLGNGHDINAIKNVVDKAKSNDPHSNGILFGTCRGASTIIQYLATYDSQWIKGIVLDSPFADPNILLKDRISPKLIKLLLPKFNKNAATPLKGIKNIKNKKIKILILFAKGNYSKGGEIKGDTVTPFNKHIKPLYDEFKKHGFDVTICGYEAEHCSGIDPEKDKGDQKAYIKAVDQWYKQHSFKE